MTMLFFRPALALKRDYTTTTSTQIHRFVEMEGNKNRQDRYNPVYIRIIHRSITNGKKTHDLDKGKTSIMRRKSKET